MQGGTCVPQGLGAHLSPEHFHMLPTISADARDFICKITSPHYGAVYYYEQSINNVQPSVLAQLGIVA